MLDYMTHYTICRCQKWYFSAHLVGVFFWFPTLFCSHSRLRLLQANYMINASCEEEYLANRCKKKERILVFCQSKVSTIVLALHAALIFTLWFCHKATHEIKNRSNFSCFGRFAWRNNDLSLSPLNTWVVYSFFGITQGVLGQWNKE